MTLDELPDAEQLLIDLYSKIKAIKEEFSLGLTPFLHNKTPLCYE